jgi:hypothetical protein
VAAHRNDFRWNRWNREQVHKHGLTEAAVEHVVRNARRPFPRRFGRVGGWQVVGRTPTYERINVLYVLGKDDGMIFVYHAM